MDVAEVRNIDGAANLLPTKTPGLRVLAYTTGPPRKAVTRVRMPCGQFQNFYFKACRLILIQLGDGC